jgi:hypothetical protein
MIAEKIEGLRPKPSDYVTVLDKAIGIDPFEVEPTSTPEPTWEYLLKGSIQSSDGFDTPERPAALFTRSGLILPTFFWEGTQIIDSGPPENYVRTKTLWLRMTSTENGYPYSDDTGPEIYYGGLRLTIGLYSEGDYSDLSYAPIIRQYQVNVRQNVTPLFLTPPSVGIFAARIVSVERL